MGRVGVHNGENVDLNIRNERATTDAAAVGLEQRLHLAERLMEVGKRCASHAPAAWLTRNFDEDRYDPQGLPR